MADWDSIFKSDGRFFLEPQEDMAGVVELLKKENARRVLDLGCGSGRHVVMLAKEGFEVYGIDVSAEGLRLTGEWLRESGLRATIREGSCYERFPFDDDFFDAVISIQVMHHNHHDKIQYCISEIVRVLKPGGIVFATVTARKTKKDRPNESRKVASRTYVPVEGREAGLPHFLYNKRLLKQDFRGFEILDIHKDARAHYCLLGRLK